MTIFESICHNIFERHHNLLKYFEKTCELCFQNTKMSK